MPAGIAEFLDRRIIVLKDTTAIHVAARAMKEQQVGCVIVYGDGGELKGIVSDRDIVCEIVANQFPLDAAISSAMTYGVFAVDEHDSLESVVKIMESNGVRRVPVVTKTPNGREKCVGIVTLDDLVAAGSVSIEQLSRIVKRQLQRRNLSPIKAMQREIEQDAHREQTLNRFYKIIAEKCLMSHRDTVQLSRLLLALIIERLPASGATRFIAQLPRMLQEDLLDLPAGPNRALTGALFIQSVASYFKKDEVHALAAISGFWKGILAFLKVDELDSVLLLLPRDIRHVLHGIGPVRKNSTDNESASDLHDEIYL